MKRFVVRKRTLLAGIVVAAGLCAGVAGAGAETQDVAAVRQVFQESQVAQQTLDIAPGLASAASGSGTGGERDRHLRCIVGQHDEWLAR